MHQQRTEITVIGNRWVEPHGTFIRLQHNPESMVLLKTYDALPFTIDNVTWSIYIPLSQSKIKPKLIICILALKIPINKYIYHFKWKLLSMDFGQLLLLFSY